MSDTASTEQPGAAPTRSCGSCTMCCQHMRIEELDKPENVLCRHAIPTGGCSIYETRPRVCREFFCLWMKHPAFDDGWKPDVCHFLLRQVDANTLTVEVDPDYPDAWRQRPFYDQIKIWSEVAQRDKGKVIVNVGHRMFGIFPEEDIDAGLIPVGGRVGMGYFREADVRQPYVSRVMPDGESDIVMGRRYRGLPTDPPHLRGGPIR